MTSESEKLIRLFLILERTLLRCLLLIDRTDTRYRQLFPVSWNVITQLRSVDELDFVDLLPYRDTAGFKK